MAFEDKFDTVGKLINLGKQKGYLLYDEVNDLLPSDVHSPEELEDVLSMFDSEGIAVLESPGAKLGIEKEDDLKPDDEESDVELAPGVLDKTNDPVRMYLREMGTVPLLTREGEVEIAKRIERGQIQVLKALSRSPIIIQEMFQVRQDLEAGERSTKEVVVFQEDELTEEKVAEQKREVIATVAEMERLHKKLIAASGKARQHPAQQASAGVPALLPGSRPASGDDLEADTVP